MATDGAVIRGKYRVLGKLGAGGMATVYKALHMGFDEVCALKVIHPELAGDPSFVKRFGQEAALTRKLQHPNAVRVEDIDQADDGRPFMVMEFIEGESPKDVIQRQRHSLDAILGPAGAISAVKSQCLHAPTWAMVCC